MVNGHRSRCSRSYRLAATAVATSVVLVAGAGFAAAYPPGNRVVNPGAEDGTLAGWQSTGFTSEPYGSLARYPPAARPGFSGDGVRLFAANTTGARLTQIVDVADLARSIDAGGQQLYFGADLGAAAGSSDTIELAFEPLGASGEPLGERVVIGAPTDGDRGGTTSTVPCNTGVTVPPGSRGVRLTLDAIGAPGANLAFADAVYVSTESLAAPPIGGYRPADGRGCRTSVREPQPAPTPAPERCATTPMGLRQLTPAPAAPTAPPVPPCPSRQSQRVLELDASRSAVRRATAVQLRGRIEATSNPAACQAGQRLELQRRTASNRTFVTFVPVTTDQNGNFAKTIRPTATAQYRALVRQTEACLTEASNTETVAVPPVVSVVTRSTKLIGRTVRLQLRCPRGGQCAGVVKLRTADAAAPRRTKVRRGGSRQRMALGAKAFQVPGNRWRTTRITVSRRIERALRTRLRVRVNAFITNRDQAGRAVFSRDRFTLRTR